MRIKHILLLLVLCVLPQSAFSDLREVSDTLQSLDTVLHQDGKNSNIFHKHVHNRQDVFHQLEKDTHTLVNLTRKYPDTVGEYLGLNVQDLFSDVPYYSQLWASHKWALRWNESLSKSATLHAQDMLARGYLSSVSPEGFGPEQRAAEQGYGPVKVHEYISVLAPQNYIQPELALIELYTRFFVHEAESFKKGNPSVFDYKLRDMGSSFASGKLTVEGKSTTVYMLVINYGTSENNLIEDYLMRMVNTARDDHNRFLEYFDVNGEEAARAMDGFLMINLTGGLSPMFFYSSASDPQLIRLEDGSLEFESGMSSMDTIYVSHKLPVDVEPYTAARNLFEQLMGLEGMQGIKMILSSRANAGIIRVSSVTMEDSIKLDLGFSTGTATGVPNVLLGNVHSSEIDNPFGPVDPPEGVHLKLYWDDKPLSVFPPGIHGDFRITQTMGSTTWAVLQEDDIIAYGSYQAGRRPLWMDLVVPVDDD